MDQGPEADDADTLSSTISYLGPAGTFTETALRMAPEAKGKRWKPVNNVGEALADVCDGSSVAAMIAVENSIEGGVTASQDALATMRGLRIQGEYVVPIRFCLAVREGTSLADIRTVSAHPVAYGQCRGWLQRHLPRHVHVLAISNVASAGALFGADPVDAAITPPTIRDQLRVDLIATDIQDNATARTRFALVSLSKRLPARTGADKTSIIVRLPEERPGALMGMLEQFAARGINMSMITSRPIAEEPGQYRFVIDLDGHLRDRRIADALVGVRRLCPDLVFLGSYPRATPSVVGSDERYSDENYAVADAWIASLEED